MFFDKDKPGNSSWYPEGLKRLPYCWLGSEAGLTKMSVVGVHLFYAVKVVVYLVAFQSTSIRNRNQVRPMMPRSNWLLIHSNQVVSSRVDLIVFHPGNEKGWWTCRESNPSLADLSKGKFTTITWLYLH